VEIESDVVAAARCFFKLPDDPRRIQLMVADGAKFVAETDKKFDLILIDGFDKNARAGVLDTQPFYQMCSTKLTNQGILSVNLIGHGRGFDESLKRLKVAFDGRALAFPSCDSGNSIAFAASGDEVQVELDDLRDYATELKANTHLNLLPTLTKLQTWHGCPAGVLRL
jgi:spermidine synthase